MDAPEVLETQEVAEETTQETPNETADERDARIAELEEKNKQLFERAKKAEAAKKAEPSNDNLSTKDVLALTEAKVSSQDFDEVVRVAQILGKPVSEALQDKTLKTILETRAEERRSAAATNTGRSPRGTSTQSGADLLRRAETTGEVPDSADGLRALAEARLTGK